MADESWIEVQIRGSEVKAVVYLRGGAVSRAWDVASRRDVEDVAAQYAIPRALIRYAEGAFPDDL